MKAIVTASVACRAAFFKMAFDYRQSDDQRYYRDVIKKGFVFEEYVNQLHRNALGIGLPAGLVPYTTFWLMDERRDTIYGVSRLRHILNANSRREGGHIGYDVPPSLRNGGNATELLRQTLRKAKAMGIMRALLTCDSGNAASARVIIKNGGVLENQVVSDYTKRLVNRYWINC